MDAERRLTLIPQPAAQNKEYPHVSLQSCREDSQILSRVVSMKILTLMLLSYLRWTFKQLTVL